MIPAESIINFLKNEASHCHGTKHATFYHAAAEMIEKCRERSTPLITDEQFQKEKEELRQYGLRQIEKAAQRVERICKNCKHLDTHGVCRNLKSQCFDLGMVDNIHIAYLRQVNKKELDNFGCNKFEELEK